MGNYHLKSYQINSALHIEKKMGHRHWKIWILMSLLLSLAKGTFVRTIPWEKWNEVCLRWGKSLKRMNVWSLEMVWVSNRKPFTNTKNNSLLKAQLMNRCCHPYNSAKQLCTCWQKSQTCSVLMKIYLSGYVKTVHF